MKRNILIIFLCSLFTWTFTQTDQALPSLPLQGNSLENFIPTGWKILKTAVGDLNQDGAEDIAAVIESATPAPEEGTTPPRILLIIFKQDKNYRLAIQTEKAILKSDEGGIMGDPFYGLDYDRGSIILTFFGGSRERWSYILRFRFQENDWCLIGLTKSVSDSLSGAETIEDYNLLNGKTIITEKQNEKTLKETKENRGKRTLLRLKDFVASEIETLTF